MSKKLWTFGDADNNDITVDVVADTLQPEVCITLPPTICDGDQFDAEIPLTWRQFTQLREAMDDMYQWVRGEGLSGEGDD